MIFSGLPIIRNSEGLECALPTSIMFHTSYTDLKDDMLSVLALYGILYHELIDEIQDQYASDNEVLPEEELRALALSQINSKCIKDKIRLNYVRVLITNKNDELFKHIENNHILVLDLDIIPRDLLKNC